METHRRVKIDPPEIRPGQVAEITVIPDEGHVGKNLTVSITGKRMRKERTTSTIMVNEGVDDIAGTTEEYRDMFIPWLEANHPELGIFGETGWNGTIVIPNIPVVMHYLFFSEEWEMHLYWHVTIEPHNWARTDLRRRYEESTPSLSFEIPSVTGTDRPRTIEPPTSTWR